MPVYIVYRLYGQLFKQHKIGPIPKSSSDLEVCYKASAYLLITSLSINLFIIQLTDGGPGAAMRQFREIDVDKDFTETDTDHGMHSASIYPR